MKSLRKIKSPAALATLGAFCVPEPFGACLVLAAAVWWSYRKWYGLRSVPTENSSPDDRILDRLGAQAGSLSAEYLPRGRPRQRAMTDRPAAFAG